MRKLLFVATVIILAVMATMGVCVMDMVGSQRQDIDMIDGLIFAINFPVMLSLSFTILGWIRPTAI